MRKTALEYLSVSQDIPILYRGRLYEEKEIIFFLKAAFAYCIHKSIPVSCRLRSLP